MSSYNSVAPFSAASLKELLEALGITQFTSGTNWYHTIAGLLIQGGFVSAAVSGVTVNFNAGFTKQVLGILIQPVNSGPSDPYVSGVTINNFTIIHGGGGSSNYYWFAIGI